MECILRVTVASGYSSLKQEWWSLIRDSRYTHSSTGKRLENTMSIMSNNLRKFSQFSFPIGMRCPITRGR